MSKSIRALIISVLLCLTVTVFAQDVQLTAINPTTLTVTGGANSRECPQTTCKVVMKLPRGTIVTADATAVGQAVSKKNNIWYHIVLADGRQAFVYSGTVAVSTAPVVVVSDPAVSGVVVEQPAAVVEQPAAAPGLAYDPNGSDRDCGDFSTHAQAQAFFEASGGPASDPHRLDGDNDGIACERLP